jgi:hypothetical protein
MNQVIFPSTVLSTLAGVLLFGVTAAGQTAPTTPAQSAAASAAPATVTADEGPAPRRFSLEAGAVAGVGINLSPLGAGPDLGVHLGGAILAGPGYVTVGVRGRYERYGASGTGTVPCAPAMGAPSAPCISPAPGMYGWSLLEQTVTLGLPIGYRLFARGRVRPYVLVQPQLVLEQADATAFDLTNTETAMRVGVAGALGAHVTLGPGALIAEAGYRWAGLPHRSTGADATLSSIGLTVGYLFAFGR